MTQQCKFTINPFSRSLLLETFLSEVVFQDFLLREAQINNHPEWHTLLNSPALRASLSLWTFPVLVRVPWANSIRRGRTASAAKRRGLPPLRRRGHWLRIKTLGNWFPPGTVGEGFSRCTRCEKLFVCYSLKLFHKTLSPSFL